jgi:hypothetical protein
MTLYNNRIQEHGQLGLVLHKFKVNPMDRATKKLQINITTETAAARDRLASISQNIVSHLRHKQRAPLQPSNRLQAKQEISPVRRNVFQDGYRRQKHARFEDLPELSSEQQFVYDTVVGRKKSCFFTGSGGTGKSLQVVSRRQSGMCH